MVRTNENAVNDSATKHEVEASTSKPPIRIDATRIPAALRSVDQWFPWFYQRREGRWIKRPLVARGSAFLFADHTDPNHWTDFWSAAAWALLMEDLDAPIIGVGFELTESDPFFCIDLDDSVDRATRTVKPWARPILARFPTYAEISPSGTGLKLFGRGIKPGSKCHAHLPDGVRIEIYDRRRFVALTGDHLPGTPAEPIDCQAELDAAYAEWFPEDTPEARAKRDAMLASVQSRTRSNRGDFADLADADLIHAACNARDGVGESFSRLWNGDLSAHDYDASRADYSLASMLAWWVGPDAARIASLMRQSGLLRSKWSDRPEYLSKTIERAIESKKSYRGDGTWQGRKDDPMAEYAGVDVDAILAQFDRLGTASTSLRTIEAPAEQTDGMKSSRDISDLASNFNVPADEPEPNTIAAAAQKQIIAEHMRDLAKHHARDCPRSRLKTQYMPFSPGKDRIIRTRCFCWGCYACRPLVESKWTNHFAGKIAEPRRHRTLHVGHVPERHFAPTVRKLRDQFRPLNVALLRRAGLHEDADLLPRHPKKRGGLKLSEEAKALLLSDGYGFIRATVKDGRRFLIASLPFMGSEEAVGCDVIAQWRDAVSRIADDAKRPVDTSESWNLPTPERQGYKSVAGLPEATDGEIREAINRIKCSVDEKTPRGGSIQRIFNVRSKPPDMTPRDFANAIITELARMENEAAEEALNALDARARSRQQKQYVDDFC